MKLRRVKAVEIPFGSLSTQSFFSKFVFLRSAENLLLNALDIAGQVMLLPIAKAEP